MGAVRREGHQGGTGVSELLLLVVEVEAAEATVVCVRGIFQCAACCNTFSGIFFFPLLQVTIFNVDVVIVISLLPYATGP